MQVAPRNRPVATESLSGLNGASYVRRVARGAAAIDR
jgi:hypothetical protein